MKIRVYYEDTDVGGVVYHSNYISFCERARTEKFFDKGLSPHTSKNEFFVVKSLEADFKKPAVFGDVLEVTTVLKEKKSASLVVYQEIFRDNELLFTLNVKLAYLKDFRPTKIPLSLLEVFAHD